MKEKEYLSVAEFGVRARKSAQTIYTMMSAGELKVKRTLVKNRTIARIPSSELAKFKT